ncbi:hypothetical protein HHK36_028075 [Tetracentron sinense]|uniref:Fungal lipase-like domain-containing protein n=1 Tax=Tetracentron sinense TaxID=13715 RepID=A0A835D1M6_TETSI|nr:hypothetical protein HHK36_028075 [Tetracentron sinense]
MKLAIGAVAPYTLQSPKHAISRSCAIPQPQSAKLGKKLIECPGIKNWKVLHGPFDDRPVQPGLGRLGKKWTEYQGIKNWEGLLDPLDENLRGELLRYGKFVEAAYTSFEFDPSSPSYAKCRFSKQSLLNQSGLQGAGYRLTKNLHATSGIQLPRWVEKGPSWVSNQSSWIGYVAVCQDKEEIARLGRRDIVIAYRGTATCLEWLENLRATLTPLSNDAGPESSSEPMVESGFLSLYNSRTATCPSLRDMVREEISRLLQSYGDEPISLTITGHSLGAALATLTAYDITTTFKRAPFVTVISFGGPRVGNRSFRCQLERKGSKILRIVNSNDLITKMPGFVFDDDDVERKEDVHVSGLPSWMKKRVEDTQWVYAEVGRELRLSCGNSPYLTGPTLNVAACHELDTYLHLVNGFVSSKCPFRDTAERMLEVVPALLSHELLLKNLTPPPNHHDVAFTAQRGGRNFRCGNRGGGQGYMPQYRNQNFAQGRGQCPHQYHKKFRGATHKRDGHNPPRFPQDHGNNHGHDVPRFPHDNENLPPKTAQGNQQPQATASMCQICDRGGHSPLECGNMFNQAYQSTSVPEAFTSLTIQDSSDPEWYPDSGATAHMTNNEGNFTKVQSYHGTNHVRVGNGSSIPISHT